MEKRENSEKSLAEVRGREVGEGELEGDAAPIVGI